MLLSYFTRTGAGPGERQLYRLREDTGAAPECLTCHTRCGYTQALLDPGARGYIQVRTTRTNQITQTKTHTLTVCLVTSFKYLSL